MLTQWQQVDEKMFMKCHEIGVKHPFMSQSMCWITLASSKVFAVVYVLFGGWLLYGKDSHLMGYLGVPAMVLLLATLLRKWIQRKRPFEVLPIDSGVPHEEGGSMPSKHASSAMIIALALLWVNPLFGLFMILLALLTGTSRVFAGVHFPSDIAVGFALSIVISLVYTVL